MAILVAVDNLAGVANLLEVDNLAAVVNLIAAARQARKSQVG